MSHHALLAVWWLLIGWTLVECRPVLRVLWRWLSCRTGHHRETVYTGEVWTVTSNPYGWSLSRGEGMEWRCMDCPQTRPLAGHIVFTPSRRYALTKRTA